MAASQVTNMENRNNRMLRPMAWAKWCVSLALLSATVSPAPSFSQGAQASRRACTPDVFRLCSSFIPNAEEITTCLREKNAELSDACRTALEAAMSASDGTEARKRTGR